MVNRITPNIFTHDPENARAFYGEILDMSVAMDEGWIVTMASRTDRRQQISFARQGGAGAEVPDISIEVEDVDLIYHRAKAAGCQIPYEITDEEWGVRRFFVRDPFGKLINVMSHI